MAYTGRVFELRVTPGGALTSRLPFLEKYMTLGWDPDTTWVWDILSSASIAATMALLMAPILMGQSPT